MEISLLLWDDANVAHIARHSVVAAEVEQALFTGAPLIRVDNTHRVGRLAVFGATANGRHLAVYLDTPGRNGSSYVLTARPMTRRELLAYQEATQ